MKLSTLLKFDGKLNVFGQTNLEAFPLLSSKYLLASTELVT